MGRGREIGLRLFTVNLSAAVRASDAAFDGLAEGTRILTPGGALRVEGLRPGQAVFAVDPFTGRREMSELLMVRSCTRECVELSIGDESLQVVPSQPIWSVDAGRFVPAGDLVLGRAGEVLAFSDRMLRARPVRATRVYAGLLRVYALVISSPLHTLVAGSIVVHDATLNESAEAPEFV